MSTIATIEFLLQKSYQSKWSGKRLEAEEGTFFSKLKKQFYILFTDYSKQVKQRVTDRFLFIHNLEERVAYTFSVRAQTIDYGPSVIGNVTTGPQSGSPGRPRDLELSKTMSSIKLSWTNSNSGRGPILGYYIESRRKGMYPIHFTKYILNCNGDGISFTLAEEEWQICEYQKNTLL